MNSAHLPWLCLIACVGCVFLGGNRVPVYEVIDAPLVEAGTVEQIGERIRFAARLQNWEIEEMGPQALLATKRSGRHVAISNITYDAASFSITLRDSIDLKQGEGQIHKLYNEWVRSLEAATRREVTQRDQRSRN